MRRIKADIDAGSENDSRHERGRDNIGVAVPILMLGIGWLLGDLDSNQHRGVGQ